MVVSDKILKIIIIHKIIKIMLNFTYLLIT